MSLLIYTIERLAALLYGKDGPRISPPPPYSEIDIALCKGACLPPAYAPLIAPADAARAVKLLRAALGSRRRSHRERCHCIESTLSLFLLVPRDKLEF